MIIAFTGHRPNKLGGYNPNPLQTWVKDQIRVYLQDRKPTKVISGMALGVDQWAAEIAISLEIPVIAAIPFVGQEKAWPQQSQLEWRNLIKKCERVVIVSEGGYSKQKMQIRNEWMVNNCTELCAIWNGTAGGTGNCVKYAQNKQCKMYQVNPLDFNPNPEIQ